MGKLGQDIGFKRLSADADGLEQFRKLNALFADAFDEEDTYSSKRPSDNYLLSLLNKDNILAGVAIINNEVVAGLVAYVLDKFEQVRKEVYIYDLAVDINYRRQKIATNLIHFSNEEALKLGAWVVYVQADRDDPPAMQLYESLGSREEVYHYDLRMNREQLQ